MRFVSQPRPGQSVLAKLATPEASQNGEAEPLRVLLLVAHPDDEAIGASAVLGRLKDSRIVYLTDGAPRDPRFRSPHVSGSRDFYACVRAEEAASALACAGVTPQRITFLNGVDQEAIQELPALLKSLLEVMSECQPSAIITHPYEGGHPDHDAAALIALLAARCLEQRSSSVPEILEMTSYHARNGVRVSGEFLPGAAEAGGELPVLTLKLTTEERARKARMLGCYLSQWHVISDFPLEPERLRVAPRYDFTKPPHEGVLWYETLGWPLTGAKWRETAAGALSQCGELPCR
ncbi:MAG TPA: PIG-L deacetylase family protein [Terriglobales bacterium]|nr:PIG-L deacetylase family protein [Terriglobales bacterium]